MASDSDWQKVELGSAWKPEAAGDEVGGVYVGKKEHVGENDSNMYTLQQPDGSVQDVWGSTVIDGQMRQVTIGSEVRIVFLGTKDSPKRKGKYYNDYEIFFRAAPMQSAKTTADQSTPEKAPLPEPKGDDEIDIDNIPF